MANYKWTMRLYDNDGDPITANYSGYSDKGTTNEIAHATDRNLGFYLNGLDDCSFSLYLDDPMSYNVDPLRCAVKVWRKITEDDGDVIYEDPEIAPSFAGVVTYASKDGDTNKMSVKAFNPLWRLQLRFHLLNHYLKRNPDTGNDYKQSELIWKLIDLVNNAFGLGVSNTGIAQGTFGWVGEPTIAPYFVPKGSNTWSNIFDDIMNRAAGSDIITGYYHDDGDPTLFFFNTEEKRGSDKSAIIKFNYRTGSGDNCENLTEEIQAVPGEFANYVWAVGQGGPNSGKVALDENNSGVTGSYGYNEIGIYMRRVDNEEIKRISALQPIATAELAQSQIPKRAYSVTVSPAADIFYGSNMDYQVGDVVELNADKYSLQVNAAKKRIYECQLSMTDNNVETSAPLVSDDFYGKVAT